MTMRATPGRLLLLLLVICWAKGRPACAADHRDAPTIDDYSSIDLTDVYAFIDPNDHSRLVLATAVNPFAVPSAPGTYVFSAAHMYQFKIDNNGDGNEDFVVQVKFHNTATGQIVDVHGPRHPNLIGARNRLVPGPPQVSGPTGGVLGDPDGVQVFTGLRDDPFVFDLSQFNRILGGDQDVFRDMDTPLGHFRGRPAAAQGSSGVDSFSGFNASYMVVSFPKDWVRGSGSKIWVWATTSQPNFNPAGPVESGIFTQIERMGQPAVNTVFIPKPLKDAFNAGTPAEDVARWSRFVPDALTTADNDGTGNTIAGRVAVLDGLGLDAFPNGAPLLLPADFQNRDPNLLRAALLPDVLRLDLDLDPATQAIGQFGIENGRRPGDDVIDIELRLLRQLADVNFSGVGAVPGSGPPRPGALNFPADRRVFVVLQGTDFIRPDTTLRDLSISGNDVSLPAVFPYIAPPHPLP
jgi:hypothetical protein